MQNYARRNRIATDLLEFNFTFLDELDADFVENPDAQRPVNANKNKNIENFGYKL